MLIQCAGGWITLPSVMTGWRGRIPGGQRSEIRHISNHVHRAQAVHRRIERGLRYDPGLVCAPHRRRCARRHLCVKGLGSTPGDRSLEWLWRRAPELSYAHGMYRPESIFHQGLIDTINGSDQERYRGVETNNVLIPRSTSHPYRVNFDCSVATNNLSFFPNNQKCNRM
jgi:hypothetical protein